MSGDRGTAMAGLRIGEVAKQTGIGIETIRFYERLGLLKEPLRRPSGYRLFDEGAVARLSFIIRTKNLGFTLSEIKDLLALWFDPVTTCCDVRRRAEQKIDEITARIQALRAMKRALTHLVGKCQQRGVVDECPLLYGLTPVPGRQQPEVPSKANS